MGFFKKVVKVAAFPLLVPVCLLFVGLVWLVWSVLVLAGKVKAGPRATWTNQTARREFKARRIEVETALSILMACVMGVWFLVAVCILLVQGTPESDQSAAVWTAMAFAPVLVLYALGLHLSTLGLKKWHQLDDRLVRRHSTPVLF